MPGIGERYRITEEVLGLQPGTVLTVVGWHGGRVQFRTRNGATAVANPGGHEPRYLPITFAPSEMRTVMVREGGKDAG